MNSLVEIFTAYGLFFGIPLIFLLIVVWVYRPGAGKRYREDGEMPFEEEDDRPEEAAHRVLK